MGRDLWFLYAFGLDMASSEVVLEDVSKLLIWIIAILSTGQGLYMRSGEVTVYSPEYKIWV
jgi:hypothetical protein